MPFTLYLKGSNCYIGSMELVCCQCPTLCIVRPLCMASNSRKLIAHQLIKTCWSMDADAMSV